MINEKLIIITQNLPLDIKKIEGRFLNEQERILLEKEIVANYINIEKGPKSLFGINNNDIRQKLYNFDNPYATKEINGIKMKICQGLIRNKRNTWLLYANKLLIGEFYNPNDIKKIISQIESKLITTIAKKQTKRRL